MKSGIIIGRFQVPFLHPGHLELIATALRECDEVTILLGSREKIDEKNFYSIKQRVDMLNKIFPQLEIIPLWDKDNNELWSKEVDIILGNIEGDHTLYHSRDSFKDCYYGKYPLREVTEVPGYSGTKIREDGNRSA